MCSNDVLRRNWAVARIKIAVWLIYRGKLPIYELKKVEWGLVEKLDADTLKVLCEIIKGS